MSDLISREEVLKAVSERKKVYETSMKDNYMEGGLDACEEIEEEIKKLPSQNKWISVEDRLPKENWHILVFDKWDEIHTPQIRVASFVRIKRDNGKIDEQFYVLHKYKITHWQPLPTPPLIDKQD